MVCCCTRWYHVFCFFPSHLWWVVVLAGIMLFAFFLLTYGNLKLLYSLVSRCLLFSFSSTTFVFAFLQMYTTYRKGAYIFACLLISFFLFASYDAVYVVIFFPDVY
jgi:hypothetical protein